MKAWAHVLFVAAVVLAIVGLFITFYYAPDEGFGDIVGGDAYNYIIIGVRGVSLICTGILAALIAVGITMIDARNVSSAEAPTASVEAPAAE